MSGFLTEFHHQILEEFGSHKLVFCGNWIQRDDVSEGAQAPIACQKRISFCNAWNDNEEETKK
jgi:hypothetical protein